MRKKAEESFLQSGSHKRSLINSQANTMGPCAADRVKIERERSFESPTDSATIPTLAKEI